MDSQRIGLGRGGQLFRAQRAARAAVVGDLEVVEFREALAKSEPYIQVAVELWQEVAW